MGKVGDIIAGRGKMTKVEKKCVCSRKNNRLELWEHCREGKDW